MTFKKTKDKSQVAVKDKDLELTRSDLLKNVFSMDRLKAAVMKVFSFSFLSLYLFSLVLMASTSR